MGHRILSFHSYKIIYDHSVTTPPPPFLSIYSSIDYKTIYIYIYIYIYNIYIRQQINVALYIYILLRGVNYKRKFNKIFALLLFSSNFSLMAFSVLFKKIMFATLLMKSYCIQFRIIWRRLKVLSRRTFNSYKAGF